MSKLPLKMSNGSHTRVHLAYMPNQPRTVIRVKSQLIGASCAPRDTLKIWFLYSNECFRFRNFS